MEGKVSKFFVFHQESEGGTYGVKFEVSVGFVYFMYKCNILNR